MAEPLKPIFTARLYPQLEQLLLELLRSLNADEWELPTLAPAWRVKDVAAHLLDTALRRLSLARDGYAPEAPQISSQADLVAFINRLNQDGVTHYRRLSPRVLISLLELAARECAAHFQALAPYAKAAFAVSWAGEPESENWFDIAREYTERWHHQQQIRLAVNKPGIMTRTLYHPVLDTFMRALPFHYRQIERATGALAQFDVTGDCGGTWYLFHEAEGWQLAAEPARERLTHVSIPQEIAWRIFTKGIDRQAASAQISVNGDRELGLHVLSMLSIIG
ncbi:MAG: maleylpyruvate isomerase N-terminal domain-containing protein [Acidobacteria bacterium]|nr:maleylpyruvate isomerase N-terminal domain-containing protein [Acidobacteriota bacterium]MBI3427021.1 maleylpyruvate isomerase N-terminal domain-containing protein [Acidobacteriota bacterium]